MNCLTECKTHMHIYSKNRTSFASTPHQPRALPSPPLLQQLLYLRSLDTLLVELQLLQLSLRQAWVVLRPFGHEAPPRQRPHQPGRPEHVEDEGPAAQHAGGAQPPTGYRAHDSAQLRTWKKTVSSKCRSYQRDI